MESTIYTVAGKDFELQHYGVKGMRWGRRKARPEPVGVGRRGGQAATDSPEAQAAAKEARQKRVKRAAIIGGSVVAAGLAVYGAKKLNDVVKDKNYRYRMRQAKEGIAATLNKNRKYSAEELIRESRFMDEVYDHFENLAKKDSFATAAKNVARDYISQRRR
jgi:hypothetical protein